MQRNPLDPPPIASPVGDGRLLRPLHHAPLFLRRLGMYACGLPLMLVLNPIARVFSLSPVILGVVTVLSGGGIVSKMDAFTRQTGSVLRSREELWVARRLVTLNMRVAFTTAACLPPIVECALLNSRPMTLLPLTMLFVVSVLTTHNARKIETRFRAQRIESGSPEEQRSLEELWERTLREWKEPRWNLSKEES